MSHALSRIAGRLRPGSLRSRLILLVLLAITPIAIATMLGGLREREAAIAASQDNLTRLTALAAANEAQSIDRARQILVDLVSVPDLMGESALCNALLTNVLERNEGYVNFGLIGLDGNVSCSAVPMLHPVNLGDRSHFKRAVAERRFIASDHVFGRVIRKHTINLTYPVIDRNGDVAAVVFAAMDLASLDTFADDISLPPGSILETADATSKLISRRPDPGRWFGKRISAPLLAAMRAADGRAVVITGEDGVERLHAFARVGPPTLTDYTITIGIPTDTITKVARDAQWLSWLGLGTTTLLALLAAWLGGEKLIVQRVRKVMTVARRIAAGDLDARTGIGSGDSEIGRLAAALDEMAEHLQHKEAQRSQAERELRAADVRKDEFLAMLAHELRNPLAPISTGAQLLKLMHSDNAHITQTCAIIARQVEHMTSLVDDLLDVSRVTRGLVTISARIIDLRSVVDDAAEQIRPLMAARRHQMVLDLPPGVAGVKGDHKRLVQVVANLLGNAAKYTPEGGHIHLTLAQDGAAWVVQITDDGIGMDTRLVERVFDLFTQAERTPDRSQGGLGLGLALAKSLAELHGGSVSAASRGIGQGSTFTVRLPRFTQDSALGQLAAPVPPTAAPASPAPMPGMAAGALRILVVDDNLDAIHTLALFLRAGGHDVELAYCALDAIDIARVFAPQVCLLDIGLPDMDGNELARRLRSMPQMAGATLIAATGYGRRQDRETASQAGFDHYLVKPLDTVQLGQILAAASVH